MRSAKPAGGGWEQPASIPECREIVALGLALIQLFSVCHFEEEHAEARQSFAQCRCRAWPADGRWATVPIFPPWNVEVGCASADWHGSRCTTRAGREDQRHLRDSGIAARQRAG